MHLSDFLSEPSHRPPAASHPSDFHSLRTGFKFLSFQPGGTSFLYNLANITRGKLSHNSGGQPGKAEKTQWVFIYVYLCMGIEAAVHLTCNAFTFRRYNLHWHKLLFSDTACELCWERTSIWKATFVNLTVLNRIILLDNCFNFFTAGDSSHFWTDSGWDKYLKAIPYCTSQDDPTPSVKE